MTANFAKNLPHAHERQAEVCGLAANDFNKKRDFESGIRKTTKKEK
jgi:hypothetical protein